MDNILRMKWKLGYLWEAELPPPPPHRFCRGGAGCRKMLCHFFQYPAEAVAGKNGIEHLWARSYGQAAARMKFFQGRVASFQGRTEISQVSKNDRSCRSFGTD